MPADKNSAKTPKVMDITQPGKSAPPASGRPIIVTNRPLIKQDPMVLSSEEGQEASAAISRVGKSIKIEPLDGDDGVKTVFEPKAQSKVTVPIAVKDAKLSLKPIAEQANDDAPAVSDEPAAVTADKPGLAPSTTPEPVAPESAQSPQSPAPVAATPPTDTPDQADSKEAPADDKQLAANKTLEEAKKKEDEEKAARIAEQEKVIESKRYYLPIHSAKDSRGLRVALILLLFVIVLGLVWLDVVLDAGIIQIKGLHALTHFFNT